MTARGFPSWLFLRRDGALKIRSGGPRGPAKLTVGTTAATAEQIGAALIAQSSVAPHVGAVDDRAIGSDIPRARARWLVPILRAAGIEIKLADGLSLRGGVRAGSGRPATVGEVAQRVTVDLDAADSARLARLRADVGATSDADAVRAAIRGASK